MRSASSWFAGLLALSSVVALGGACGGSDATVDIGDGGADGAPSTDGGGTASDGGAGGDGAAGTFAIGGTVSGLAGTGLVLHDSNGDDLPITKNGTFTFAKHRASGDSFVVTVGTQPINPSQNCVVSGGTGVVGTADVTSVTVNCAANRFTVGGTVQGLVGSVVLRNGAPQGDGGVAVGDGGAADAGDAGVTGDLVTVSSNGTFAFPTTVASGDTYNVSVLTQPVAAHCTLFAATDGGTPGVGTVGNGNVTSLDVRCAATPTLTPVASSCTGTFSGNFAWSTVTDASYVLEYGLQGGAVTTVNLAVGVTTFAPGSPLGAGTYDWRVRAVRNGALSDFSPTSTFTVASAPATPTASSSGTICGGTDLSLTTPTVGGATYAWTGPNGFTSTEQNPVISAATTAATGTYNVVVTVGGCASNPGSTTATVNSGSAGQFSQTLSADFATDTISNGAITSSDEVSLDGLGTGSEGTYAPSSNTTIAGGEHHFTSIHIPSGVTVTVTGSAPLVLRSQGSVVIDGVLDASGAPGANAVTFQHGGAGGQGVAGGSNGGDGVFDPSNGPLDGAQGSGSGGGGLGKGWSGGGGAGYSTVGGASGGTGGAAGTTYGSVNNFVAGSGGGSGSGGNNCGSGGGGAGGGAIRILGTTISVTATGSVHADGGHGGTDGTGNCGGGGGGSGGMVWLYATSTVNVAGTVSAQGGAGGDSTLHGAPYFGVGGSGGLGRVRIDGSLTSSGTITPSSASGNALLNDGAAVTQAIAPSNLCSWGTLTFTTSIPSNTTLTVDVLDGSSNAVLVSGATSGSSLSSLSATSLKLRVNLARSTTPDVTPALLDWTLGYSSN